MSLGIVGRLNLSRTSWRRVIGMAAVAVAAAPALAAGTLAESEGIFLVCGADKIGVVNSCAAWRKECCGIIGCNRYPANPPRCR